MERIGLLLGEMDGHVSPNDVFYDMLNVYDISDLLKIIGNVDIHRLGE